MISPALFHTASTLSGSLRSPPSPRGEGFVRRYSFSTYACIRSDNARKAAFSYRHSLPPWGRGTAQRWIGCSRKRRTCDDLLRSLSYRFPHPTSAPSGHLLPKEGGSVHASPFPWKGLPSAARRGWFPFGAAKPPPLCLPRLEKGTAQRRSRIRCS